MEIKNILIVGVGGQGILLAGNILGNAFVSLGFDVKVSEVHGMSQRGGSVVTYLRYGNGIASPVLCKGEADYMIAFEPLEAARWLPYLKPDGIMIVNTRQINPMPVITGAAKYPGCMENIKAAGVNFLAADALSLAKEAGSERAVNTVLLGIFAALSDTEANVIRESVRMCVPPKSAEINLAAFDSGAAAGAEFFKKSGVGQYDI